jgi:hypothetical protein
MPAIQVYKSNGIMIPVDDAKKSKAYICPWTKELYATKRSYVNHLKSLRTTRMHKRARDLAFTRRLEGLWNQPDFTGVINWIEANPDVFWTLANRNCWHSGKTKWAKVRDEFGIKIQYLSLDFSESISNSHSCPHTGVTNWGGDRKLPDGSPAPRGYPGFGGRISFKLTHDTPSFCSDIFKSTRIHTGTGGGGGNNIYTYGVSFFLDDWPGIAKTLEAERHVHDRAQTIATLSRKSTTSFKKSFSYGKDPWKTR